MQVGGVGYMDEEYTDRETRPDKPPILALCTRCWKRERVVICHRCGSLLCLECANEDPLRCVLCGRAWADNEAAGTP